MRVDLNIRQGSTYRFIFRWETKPVVYKTITGITATAPVRLTVPAHGLVSGWRAAVSDVKGMAQINAAKEPPRDNDFEVVTVVDPNTIEFNAVNASSFSPYVSGGVLRYNTPASLGGFTARMKIRERLGGPLLLELTTENNRIALDPVNFTITLRLTAAETQELSFLKGVYDLEMVSAAGDVTPIAEGAVRLVREITTST